MTCEHCWGERIMRQMEYSAVIDLAEREHWPCTADTPEGRKLRAGQFWDETTQRDTRVK